MRDVRRRVIIVDLARSMTAPAPLHVLVVDDDAAVVRSLARLLRREFEVTACTRPEEVLERIERGERFDAIVCDGQMPGLGGLELHQRIATIDARQATRFVFVSASLNEPDIALYVARCALPALLKPVSFRDLRDAILRSAARAR